MAQGNKARNRDVVQLAVHKGLTNANIVGMLRKKYPKITTQVVEGILRRYNRSLLRKQEPVNMGVESPTSELKTYLKESILQAFKIVSPELIKVMNAVVSETGDTGTRQGLLNDEARSAFRTMTGIEPGLRSVSIELLEDGSFHMEFLKTEMIEVTI